MKGQSVIIGARSAQEGTHNKKFLQEELHRVLPDCIGGGFKCELKWAITLRGW